MPKQPASACDKAPKPQPAAGSCKGVLTQANWQSLLTPPSFTRPADQAYGSHRDTHSSSCRTG